MRKEGPFGGPQGTPFDVDNNRLPESLASIKCWTKNGEISAMSFTYKDESGTEIPRGPFGQTAGAKELPEVRVCVSIYIYILYWSSACLYTHIVSHRLLAYMYVCMGTD